MQSFRIWFWLLVLCCYCLIFTRCWNSEMYAVKLLKLCWVLKMFTCLKKKNKKESQPTESFKNSPSPPGIQLQMPASCFPCPGHAFLVSLFLWMFLAGGTARVTWLMNREIGERGAGGWPPAIPPSHLLLGLSFQSHDLSCAIVVQCGCRLCGHCWDWHFILMLCAMTFSKAFYLAPVALCLTKKNIIRVPSSWICILAEFTGTHYVPHLLKHRSADAELNYRLHFPWKCMQIVIYLPISTHAGFSHNMDLSLKELFPNLWCRIKLKKKN